MATSAEQTSKPCVQVCVCRRQIMESDSLVGNMGCLANNGVVLSVEQRSSLEFSLVLLRREHKFRRVKLWGVIKGVQGDYFIAMGVGGDELKERKALYSQDCLQWSILPHVDKARSNKARLLQGRFTGDPSYVYEHSVTSRVGDGDNATEQVTSIEMKEDERLAAVVKRIDDEVAVVPKGAYIRTPRGETICNRSFEGLSLTEAKQLKYYYHFRPSTLDMDQNKSLKQSIEFLDSIDSDIPAGAWSVYCVQGGATVVLRSLQWMGFVAYHVPETTNFGYFYCGYGEKNSDLLFML